MVTFVDVVLVLLLLVAAYFGRHRGTVRQTLALAGVVTGIVVASLVYNKVAFLTQSSILKTVVLVAILSTAIFLLYDIATTAGARLQKWHKLKRFRGSQGDTIGAAVVSALGCFVVAWLFIPMFKPVMPQVVQGQVQNSLILSVASTNFKVLPSVNNVAQLLEPFSAPDIFSGQEPTIRNQNSIGQTYQNLDAAIAKVTPSVLKITSWGCGKTAAGSGFVVGARHIVTNAHVVAGSERISVLSNGVNLPARIVVFDPALDFAVLATDTVFTNTPLTIVKDQVQPGVITAVLGYPGGGDFQAGDAIMLDRINAQGYDIYHQQKINRTLYALRGDVVPGNSGGPVINSSGHVVGLIIGHSTTQNKTGYAVTADQIADTIKAAQALSTAVSSGACAAG